MNSISHIPLSQGAKIVLYADDILLYKPINSAGDTSNLQEDVDVILKWICEHGLKLSMDKTDLFFGRLTDVGDVLGPGQV